MSVQIEISDTAADCLAFFMGHPFYRDTPEGVIINLTEEWGFRQRTPELPAGSNILSECRGLWSAHLD